jgi:hypothetical protein
MKLFRNEIKALDNATLNFDLLTGTSEQDAKRLLASTNEWILGVSLISTVEQ